MTKILKHPKLQTNDITQLKKKIEQTKTEGIEVLYHQIHFCIKRMKL